MTNDSIIAAWSRDPSVISAHTTTGPGGLPQTPSEDYLKDRCGTVLQVVLADMLSRNTIRKALGRAKRSIASGLSATETLKSEEAEIVAVTIGTEKRPLTPFLDELDYVNWYYDRYGETDATSTEDQAIGYYVFFSTAADKWQMTFVPGIGDKTSADIWYLSSMEPPFQVERIPSDLHYAVYIGGLSYLVGGEWGPRFEDALGRVAERLDPIQSGISKIRHDPDVQRRNNKRNFSITDTVG